MAPDLLPLAFGIGVVAGLRAFTAPAVVSWAVRLQVVDVAGSRWASMGSTPVVVVLSLLAILELVNDKLPRTTSRTKIGPLVARLVTGGISGAVLVAGAGESPIAGAVAGAVGALAGTFGGYQARVRSVRRLGTPDYVIALAEDAIAVGAAILIASRV